MVVSHAYKHGLPLSNSLALAAKRKITPQQLQQQDSANLKTFVDGVQGVKNKTIGTEVTMFARMIKTLQRLADEGPEAFYSGEIAEDIVNATGSSINKGDLESYK